MRAGRYFVWQLLALTDLYKNAKTKEQTQTIVDLGWELHNEIAFWKWAIDQQLVRKGESLCARFYDHIQRAPTRHCYYLPRRQLYSHWGILPRTKSVLAVFAHRRARPGVKQSATKKADPITINVLKLTDMMISAFVMQITKNDRPEYAGDAVLLRGDNVSVVSWLNHVAGRVISAPHL